MADVSVLKTQIRNRATFAVREASPRLRQKIQATSPVETNRMKINSQVTPQGLTARVRIATPYASFVREGTQPHVIRPRTKKMLAFFWPQAPAGMRRLPDGRVLARSVNHPGTSPNPWYDDALAEWPTMLKDALRRAPS